MAVEKPRVNDEIRHDKVRVIKPDDSHEIVSLDDAIDIAFSYDKDLIEVAPNADPPVCKVRDFGKYMYEMKKKEKEAKKKQNTVELKELRFSPHTEEHDMKFKTRHAREFLDDGNKVKCTVQFKGRDMLYTERGEDLLRGLAEDLEDISKIETKPTMEGRRMIMVLAPEKKN